MKDNKAMPQLPTNPKNIAELDEVKAAGLRLRCARLALGLTAKDLCTILDVQQNTFSQWENGARAPSWYVMARLSKTYMVTLDWIYAANPSGMPSDLMRRTLMQWAELTSSKNNNNYDYEDTEI